MPSTRKQKAKARKWRELDILSDYGNIDVMLGDGNSNSIEKELLSDYYPRKATGLSVFSEQRKFISRKRN